mmetsp:Transcript_106714/g.311960  ORF Transcript_106714/g.311960 Transcript_106714/m.311960 type:complete len:240 (-) Transcript_106714:75-794(-)
MRNHPRAATAAAPTLVGVFLGPRVGASLRPQAAVPVPSVSSPLQAAAAEAAAAPAFLTPPAAAAASSRASLHLRPTRAAEGPPASSRHQAEAAPAAAVASSKASLDLQVVRAALGNQAFLRLQVAAAASAAAAAVSSEAPSAALGVSLVRAEARPPAEDFLQGSVSPVVGSSEQLPEISVPAAAMMAAPAMERPAALLPEMARAALLPWLRRAVSLASQACLATGAATTVRSTKGPPRP